MSKIVLDEFPKEPNECPFSKVHCSGWDGVYYLCHLNASFDFDCKYALGECIGCENCEKITSLSQKLKGGGRNE